MKHLLTLLLTLLILPIYSQSITSLTNIDPYSSLKLVEIVNGINGDVFYVTNDVIWKENNLNYTDGTIEGSIENMGVIYEDDYIESSVIIGDSIYFASYWSEGSSYRIDKKSIIDLSWQGGGWWYNDYNISKLLAINEELFFLDINTLYKFNYQSNPDKGENKIVENVKSIVVFNDEFYILYNDPNSINDFTYNLATYNASLNSFTIIRTDIIDNSQEGELHVLNDFVVCSFKPLNGPIKVIKTDGTLEGTTETMYDLPGQIKTSIGNKGVYYSNFYTSTRGKVFVYDFMMEKGNTIEVGEPKIQSINSLEILGEKIYLIGTVMESDQISRNIYVSDFTLEEIFFSLPH